MEIRKQGNEKGARKRGRYPGTSAGIFPDSGTRGRERESERLFSFFPKIESLNRDFITRKCRISISLRRKDTRSVYRKGASELKKFGKKFGGKSGNNDGGRRKSSRSMSISSD